MRRAAAAGQRHCRHERAAALRGCPRRVLRRAGQVREIMTTVEEEAGSGAEGTGGDQAAAAPAARPAWGRWRAVVPWLSGLVRRHRLFAIALGAAVLPRLVAMAGFWPAVLFRLDTYDYLWGAVHVSPNVVNPSGY